MAERLFCGWQAYPRIYEAALQGSKALQQIYKQGPVDMSDLATRLTAGGFLCNTCCSGYIVKL